MFRQTRKFIALIVLAAFVCSSVQAPAFAQEPLNLPAPGTMVDLSPAYVPVLVKGLRVHPDNPLMFDFILDTGHSGLKVNSPAFKTESQKLIKYFLAALTIREDDLWVNLSPYENDRIVPQALGQTELGRDMLAQDYILKQLTASLIDPEKNLGRKFWNRVYTKARQMYGTDNIPVDTFNKVWIVADKAKVLVRHHAAYVVGAHLKLMMQEDYLAAYSHQRQPGGMFKSELQRTCSQTGCPKINLLNVNSTGGNHLLAAGLGSQIVREIILPELEKEVNQGRNFASLRQIFYAMILATWYKLELKDALLNQVYSDKGKISGVLSDDPAVKEKIYEQYLKAYKKGVFNFIKYDPGAGGKQLSPRKYFSGGMVLGISKVFERVQSARPGEMASVGDLAMAAVNLDVQGQRPGRPDQAMNAPKEKESLLSNVFVFNSDHKLYLQIRRDGRLDVSAVGGISEGSNGMEAVQKEAREKLGLEIDPSRMLTIVNGERKDRAFSFDFHRNAKEGFDGSGVYHVKTREPSKREIFEVFGLVLNPKEEERWRQKVAERIISWQDFLGSKQNDLNDQESAVVEVDPRDLVNYYLENANFKKRLSEALRGLLAHQSIRQLFLINRVLSAEEAVDLIKGNKIGRKKVVIIDYDVTLALNQGPMSEDATEAFSKTVNDPDNVVVVLTYGNYGRLRKDFDQSKGKDGKKKLRDMLKEGRYFWLFEGGGGGAYKVDRKGFYLDSELTVLFNDAQHTHLTGIFNSMVGQFSNMIQYSIVRGMGTASFVTFGIWEMPDQRMPHQTLLHDMFDYLSKNYPGFGKGPSMDFTPWGYKTVKHAPLALFNAWYSSLDKEGRIVGTVITKFCGGDASLALIIDDKARQINLTMARVEVKSPEETTKVLDALREAKNDMAMTPHDKKNGINKEVGGIDLNARHMGLELAQDGPGVDMKFDPALIAQFRGGDFSGFVPVIIRINPIPSVLNFI